MLEEVEQYFLEKIKLNEDFIRITFYELRVKYNMSETDTEEFLDDAKAFLQGKGYLVYFTDDNYYYKTCKTVVQSNELLIAIKKSEQEINNKAKNGTIKK